MIRHRRTLRLVAAAALLLCGLVPVAGAGAIPRCAGGGPAVERSAGLPQGIGEVSGLVASQRHPGWWWMIRDSGNPASLFAARWPEDGGPPEVREIRLAGASNLDWEELVYRWGPDGGRLTIVESGQFGKSLFLYDVPEPDPLGPASVRNFTRYDYAYPGQGAINTESAFWFSGRMVLVTKERPGRVYRFERPLEGGTVNIPVLAGTLAEADFISVAKVSSDYRTIVAANHETVLVYRSPEMRKDLASLIARPVLRCRHVAPGDNIEAGDFLSGGRDGLLLIAESRNVYRLPGDV